MGSPRNRSWNDLALQQETATTISKATISCRVAQHTSYFSP